MVNEDQVYKMLMIMGEFYNFYKFPKSTQEETDFTVQMWHRKLQKFDPKLVMEAFNEYTDYNTEVPTPAHIIQVIKNMTTDKIDGNQAWHKLTTTIKRYGIYRAKEAMDSLPPAVKETVNLMGGYELFCKSEEGDTYLQNAFVKNYSQAVEVEERERLLPEGMKEQRQKLLDKLRGGQANGRLLIEN